MRGRLLLGLLLAATPIGVATAAMAPPFERAQQLASAMERLCEVARMQPELNRRRPVANSQRL